MKNDEIKSGSGIYSENELTKIRQISINELSEDSKNANIGTDLGDELLTTSVSKHGIGRGVLADKNLNLIAGNHAVRKMKELGFENVIVVPTDGKTLVVTQRTDIELNSKAGRELALADNRVTEANLRFDIDVIKEHQLEFGIDIDELAINLDALEDAEESDPAEQMEYEPGGREPAYKQTEQITQNLFPVMAALTKAQRLEFDKIKKSFDSTSDTETIIELMKFYNQQS